ncbi:MAG: hypothetical protein CMP49_02660 [Flavobacteriales bacterium]|nr:hypothetical protein [Flavobacteriales bacterium]
MANIIPGLSGSTLALILGVYQKLINILTKFDLRLIQLIKSLNINEIQKHISLNFISAILCGIIISFISISHLLNYLFLHFETYTWAYFFGIILVSIYYVGNYIDKFKIAEYLLFLLGLSICVIIFLAEPSMEQNTNLLFVFLCGIIGVTGMLIPGLSGSYLLVLLGNYKLLISETIHRISDPKYYAFDDIYFYLKLFITFLIGHIVGIITFSRIIKWLLNNFKNQTFSLLTGFITGSLLWIWPWQSSYSSMDKNLILFSKISFPDFKDINDLILIAVIICGGITLILIEKIAKKYRDV